ncbi:asparagine synthase-related protein [Cytobacillus kochii]
MKNWPGWITTQAHTGSQYPYYYVDNEGLKNFDFDINNIIKNHSGKLELNISSVIEILHKGYIFGDETLINGIKRTPWLADINQNDNWDFYNIPNHSEIIEDHKSISGKVKSLLYQELLNNIGNSKRVGILLSGGLDSRIIAGILKEAQLNKEFSGNVVVYNWGIESSRDVIYAKKIADIYNWDYIHFRLTAEVLKENFYNCLMVGAEISPIHLHAMIKVRDDENSDIIIAGTYGDSLGRGLYSGLHFSNLNNILNENINKLSLIKDNVLKEYRTQLEKDYFIYQTQLTGTKQPYQLREVEQNIHYLRRLLATAMSIIAQKKPIYQSFTSPEIVKYIWSLDKSVRNDDVYKEILAGLPNDIGNIPYAKTGKSFVNDRDDKEIDTYHKDSHDYSNWLKNELKSFIDKELDLEVLQKTGIFNNKSLYNLYNFWPKAGTNSMKKFDSIISWLTVFSIFVKRYNVQSEKIYSANFVDKINSMIVIPKIRGYEILQNK